MQPSSQQPSQPASHGPGWQAGILYNVAASTLRQIITKMRFPRRGIHLVLGSCPEGDKFVLIASEGSDILVYTAAVRLRHRNITGWQHLSHKGGHAMARVLVVSDSEAQRYSNLCQGQRLSIPDVKHPNGVQWHLGSCHRARLFLPVSDVSSFVVRAASWHFLSPFPRRCWSKQISTYYIYLY